MARAILPPSTVERWYVPMTPQTPPNPSARKALAPATQSSESSPNPTPANRWAAGVYQELVTLMFYVYDFL
jgi:hypothetical protein